jgi:hypothetical protein
MDHGAKIRPIWSPCPEVKTFGNIGKLFRANVLVVAKSKTFSISFSSILILSAVVI